MMRAGEILDVELEEKGKIRQGKVEILFHKLTDYIVATDIEIHYWVCKLISGNIPNYSYQAVRQGENTVHLIPLGKRLLDKPPPVLRVLHKEDEIEERQCPKCKGLGFEDRETKKAPGIVDTLRCSCSKCSGTGWIRVN